MQVILEVTSENAVGVRAWLRPGQTIKVGRSELADLAIPNDPQLSGEHFALECSTNGCVLRDLQSSNGTTLNGERVAHANINDGDRIAAGQTRFSISVNASDTEGVDPIMAPISARSGVELKRNEITDDPLTLLKKSELPLYAILDAARDPMVLANLVHCDEMYESLYEGPKGQQLVAVAPHLVQLSPNSQLLETIVEQGWGNSWGIFLTCDKTFAEVRKHLRRFLMVETEENKQLYFRFYDPRVLRSFLPSCTTDELGQFFGPIKEFYMEDEKPETILCFAA